FFMRRPPAQGTCVENFSLPRQTPITSHSGSIRFISLPIQKLILGGSPLFLGSVFGQLTTNTPGNSRRLTLFSTTHFHPKVRLRTRALEPGSYLMPGWKLLSSFRGRTRA